MRTSWNVGLATGALDPVPSATPRTKVVFPAPSSPLSRTTSPDRSLFPQIRPRSSVWAAELVVTSGKVVVTGAGERDRRAARIDDLDRRIFGQHPDRLQARLPEKLGRSGAHELGLLAAGQCILGRGSRRARHVLAPQHGAHARHRSEFLHLADEPVRDVAAAKPKLVEAATLLNAGDEPVRAAFAQRYGGR